jgi:hypothetical protein
MQILTANSLVHPHPKMTAPRGAPLRQTGKRTDGTGPHADLTPRAYAWTTGCFRS